MIKELRHHVSLNIKLLREKQNITQEELSEISTVGYKYLQSIEGKNPPNISLRTIEKLSKALKIHPQKFFNF